MGLAHEFLARSPQFVVRPEAVEILAAAPWLTRSDVVGIRADSGLAGRRFHFFEDDLARIFAEGYARSAWVESVLAAAPRYPDRVEVALEIRRPVARIDAPDGSIRLIDAEGRRLPGVRHAAPEGLPAPLLSIVGVEAPPPLPGEIWSGPVREAASVATVLAARPDLVAAAGITAIDVGNVGLRRDRIESEIVLVAADGVVVEWGRSERSPRAVAEPSPEHKLTLLERVLEAFPGFAGLSRVRVQFEEAGWFRRE